MYFVLKISITIKLLQSVYYRLIAYFAKAFFNTATACTTAACELDIVAGI
jgi:hypothetical protein